MSRTPTRRPAPRRSRSTNCGSAQVWAGEAVLLRANRGYVATDAPFNFRWLVELVLQEKRSLRDIGLASLDHQHPDDLPADPRHGDGQQGAAVPLGLDPGADLGIARRRLDLRDVARLCPAADHRGRRRAARHQAQPAPLQSAPAPAARLFRAPPGRPDDVPGRPGLPGARVPDRPAAGDLPRPPDPGGAAAVPVLAQRAAGLGRDGLRGGDQPDHPRLSEAAARRIRPGCGCGDLEGRDPRRDHRRHQDRQVPGARAAAPRAMGRAGRRDRQVAARLRAPRQLAADPGHPDRALHGHGHDDGRRLLGDGRSDGLHGRRALRLHDAERQGGGTARRLGAARAGIRGGQRGDRRGGRGAEPALGDRRRLGRAAAAALPARSAFRT